MIILKLQVHIKISYQYEYIDIQSIHTIIV